MTPEQFQQLLKNQELIINNQNIINGKLNKVVDLAQAIVDNQFKDANDLDQIKRALADVARSVKR